MMEPPKRPPEPHRKNLELNFTSAEASTSFKEKILHNPRYFFFYGTLTSASLLKRLLNLKEEPLYYPAKIYGFSMSQWGVYPALIAGIEHDVVEGMAYKVRCIEDQEILSAYETDAYEIRQCLIFLIQYDRDVNIPGYTYVYAGDPQALEEDRIDTVLWEKRMGVPYPLGKKRKHP